MQIRPHVRLRRRRDIRVRGLEWSTGARPSHRLQAGRNRMKTVRAYQETKIVGSNRTIIKPSSRGTTCFLREGHPYLRECKRTFAWSSRIDLLSLPSFPSHVHNKLLPRSRYLAFDRLPRDWSLECMYCISCVSCVPCVP